MSGGKFCYKDRSAKAHIHDALTDDISYGNKQIERAELILSISNAVFDWLEDYDLAASHDTTWETYDESEQRHMRVLVSLIEKAQSELSEDIHHE